MCFAVLLSAHRPHVNQVYRVALDTKVKDQTHKHWAYSEAALISHSNTNDVFTSDRQRGPSEFLMKALFEILNKLKLIHDFLIGPVEASRIADCFSNHEQTSTGWGRGAWLRHISSIFLPHTILISISKWPISCPVCPDVFVSNLMTQRPNRCHIILESFSPHN